MTEDNKGNPIPKPAAKPMPREDLNVGIPVALARFERPLQLPGKQADDTCKTEKLPNGRRWEVHYLPQWRHHRVIFHDEARGKAPEVAYVPESRVLGWWPIPQ